MTADENYIVLDIKVLINSINSGAADDYYVVLDINVLINSVAVDEYITLFWILRC